MGAEHGVLFDKHHRQKMHYFYCYRERKNGKSNAVVTDDRDAQAACAKCQMMEHMLQGQTWRCAVWSGMGRGRRCYWISESLSWCEDPLQKSHWDQIQQNMSCLW